MMVNMSTTTTNSHTHRPDNEHWLHFVMSLLRSTTSTFIILSTLRDAVFIWVDAHFMQKTSYSITTITTVLRPFFPGPPGWAGARRELLDFIVQGKTNRGRHTDHPAGRHSIRTNQCPPSPSPPFFYRPDDLSATQPTVSKHCRQLFISWKSQFHGTKYTKKLTSSTCQELSVSTSTMTHCV